MADKDLAAFLREHVIVIPVVIPPPKPKPKPDASVEKEA